MNDLEIQIKIPKIYVKLGNFCFHVSANQSDAPRIVLIGRVRVFPSSGFSCAKLIRILRVRDSFSRLKKYSSGSVKKRIAAPASCERQKRQFKQILSSLWQTKNKDNPSIKEARLICAHFLTGPKNRIFWALNQHLSGRWSKYLR